MRIPRIYCPTELQLNQELILENNASNHLLQVLRLKLGDSLLVFNGSGNEYNATLSAIDKSAAIITIGDLTSHNSESKLSIHLAQAIAKGEKMDFIVQKATELGITKFTPLFTERCDIKLTAAKAKQRQQRWQLIAINACEQSGRTIVPQIAEPENLSSWVKEAHSRTKIILEPTAKMNLGAFATTSNELLLLIGPEGGFTTTELELATAENFAPLKLGPRILRTETAALAAISTLQTKWGDFS